MAHDLRHPAELRPFGDPDPDHLIGLAWHHALHARVAVERGRPWQAEHWISAIRDHVITLACLRLGHPAGYARTAHLLPAEVTGALEPALVRDLTTPELTRALAAAIAALSAELARTSPALAARLTPMLRDLTSVPTAGRTSPDIVT